MEGWVFPVHGKLGEKRTITKTKLYGKNHYPPNDELRECKCCGQLKPITMFRKSARGGYTSVCSECVREKYHATHHKRGQDKRIASLNDYSPRELMEELARRGYKGKLTYTRIETIDITDF